MPQQTLSSQSFLRDWREATELPFLSLSLEQTLHCSIYNTVTMLQKESSNVFFRPTG